MINQLSMFISSSSTGVSIISLHTHLGICISKHRLSQTTVNMEKTAFSSIKVVVTSWSLKLGVLTTALLID